MPTTAPRPARARVLAAFAAVYVIWGSTYLAIRYAIETLPPFLMAGVRFTIAGALLYAWCRWRGAPRPSATGVGWAALVGVLLLGVGNGGVVWAETRVPSGITALVVASVALWIVLVEWIRPGGRRPAALVLVGVVVGLAGVALLVGPAGGSRGAGGVDVAGAVALNVASLSWAVGSLLARDRRMPRPTLFGAAVQMLAGGATLLLAGTLAGEWGALDVGAVSGRSLLAVGYLVAAGSLVGYTAYIWLVANVPPVQASTYAYVNPIVAVILGWAIAGERIDGRMLVAMAVIVGAVALVSVGQHARSPRSS